MTVLKTLIALFKYCLEGFARYGCGVAGLPYPEEDKITLP